MGLGRRGLEGLGQGAGDSGPQEVGTEEAEEMPDVGGRGPPARAWEADGVLGGSEGPVENVGKTGRMGGGVRLGSRVSEEAMAPCPALGFWSREELRWHFRATSLADGVG